MISVENKFIPALKRSKQNKQEQTILAETECGDKAFYMEPSSHYDSDESDDDDDDEFAFHDDEIDEFYHPIKSVSGAPWTPHLNERLSMFIAGTPGAGKSYLAKQMIKLLPDTIPILLFTALEEKDGNFDEIGTSRLYKIRMTPEVLSSISLKEIRERAKTDQIILLFDDVDKIRDKRVQNLTFAIMNDALANGRGHEKHDGKGDIHVICTSHSANDYQKTKYTFENSNFVALFPGTTPVLQMQLMFNKMGLDKDLCNRMIQLGRRHKVRSIIIHKVVPMYIIFGDKIMLL